MGGKGEEMLKCHFYIQICDENKHTRSCQHKQNSVEVEHIFQYTVTGHSMISLHSRDQWFTYSTHTHRLQATKLKTIITELRYIHRPSSLPATELYQMQQH